MAENRIITEGEEQCIDEDGEVDSSSSGVEPGDLLDLNSSGYYDAHGTAGETNAQPRFARKAGEIGGDIGDSYASGDWIKVAYAQPGVKVYAYLDAGENVDYDEELESAGNGKLRSRTDPTSPNDPSATVARAIEAVDNSTGGDPVRVEVEVV